MPLLALDVGSLHGTPYCTTFQVGGCGAATQVHGHPFYGRKVQQGLACTLQFAVCAHMGPASCGLLMPVACCQQRVVVASKVSATARHCSWARMSRGRGILMNNIGGGGVIRKPIVVHTWSFPFVDILSTWWHDKRKWFENHDCWLPMAVTAVKDMNWDM